MSWAALIERMTALGLIRDLYARDNYSGHFTERELKVFPAVVRGCKQSLIANQLGITAVTVESHWRHIRIKLGVADDIEAIHKAYELAFPMRLQAELAAATAPLHQTIAELRDQIRALHELEAKRKAAEK